MIVIHQMFGLRCGVILIAPLSGVRLQGDQGFHNRCQHFDFNCLLSRVKKHTEKTAQEKFSNNIHLEPAYCFMQIPLS
jgi:hypothetical protein